MPIALNTVHLLVLYDRSLSSFLPYARIYAGVLGPRLGRLAYMSHVV